MLRTITLAASILMFPFAANALFQSGFLFCLLSEDLENSAEKDSIFLTIVVEEKVPEEQPKVATQLNLSNPLNPEQSSGLLGFPSFGEDSVGSLENEEISLGDLSDLSSISISDSEN
ncbi:MAG: hypothetical protein ACPGN3_11085 [Opitutales bacterium]